jgi:hypothetical protein
MTDNIAAFRPSYRPKREEGVFTADMWRMVAIAGGITGGLALLVAGSHLLGHRHGGAVPVIEAQAGPIRVKPDHPGGMSVAGATDEAQDQTEKLAPAAEAPRIDMLKAQLKAATRKIARQQAELIQAARVGPRIAPPAPVEHAASLTPLSLLPPSPPVLQLPAIVAPQAGTMEIQLAAFDSEAGARADWAALRKKIPGLRGRAPDIQQAEFAGHPIWRLRTGGFASVAEAATFCAHLRDQGTDCKIAAF